MEDKIFTQHTTRSQRRGCIKITGIPILQLDNPKKLVQELGSLNDVSLSEDQISTVHRLPDTKKVKN